MSVNDIQNSLLKYKKALAILVSLSILLCGAYLGVKQTYTAQIYIRYLGARAEEGIAENGTALDPYEISNAFVVQKALEQIGASDMDVTGVRRAITIAPIIALSEEEKYASFLDNFSSYENEEKKPFPTSYQIKFRTAKGAEFARSFLNALVEQYSLYYAKNYASISDITVMDKATTLGFDYYETVEELERKFDTVRSTLSGIADGDVDYRSPRTGWSVQDLICAYADLEQMQFAGVAQYVLDKGASKTPQLLTAALHTKADNAELESLRYAEQADTQYDLMQTYSLRNRDYLWESGADEESSQVRTEIERDEGYEEYKTTYDQMMMEYVFYEATSRDLAIDRVGYEKDALAFSRNSKSDDHAEQALQAICDRFNELQEQTELVLEDYNTYKAARYLGRLSGISVDEAIGEVFYYVASVILSLGMGVVVVIFIQMRKKKMI